MADKHGAHQTGEAYVVSLSEDFCKSPDKPVGYMISQKLDMSTLVCKSVNGCGTPVLNMSSRITNVTGNEAGVGGGVVSGVNVGMCKPVENYAPKVRAEGQYVLRHDTVMEMNTAGPGGTGNTKGKIHYSETGSQVTKNQHGGKHYSTTEVISMLRDIENKNLLDSYFDHNGGGMYDFKKWEPDATFDVFGQTMTSGEYGNFLAGFAGKINGGALGEAGVRAGGWVFDLTDSVQYKIARYFGLNPKLPPGDLPPEFDWDADSKPAIDQGVHFAEMVANGNREQTDCPSQIDGVTQLYIGGPCGS